MIETRIRPQQAKVLLAKEEDLYPLIFALPSGSYWIRTSDLYDVNVAL